QKTEDWLLGHRKAFEYFGGVTQVIVPDNPRSLVANPDRYEPQDKGKVEVGVQVVERWILARLRRQQFFSLSDLNLAIADLL
ncbi:IS21 family transposase, partial [Polynucleobacter sp. MG-28-Ekke-A2]|nr:IS21 family transposase [Polynucleobacter sp. MG-28-Ekke-A2]